MAGNTRVEAPRESNLPRSSERPESQSEAKRRKTKDKSSSRVTSHQACVACKTRKVRCDNSRPKCSYCVLRNDDCVYPPVYKRATCSQAHVNALEARLAQLEAQYGVPPEAPDYTHYITEKRNKSLPQQSRGGAGSEGRVTDARLDAPSRGLQQKDQRSERNELQASLPPQFEQILNPQQDDSFDDSIQHQQIYGIDPTNGESSYGIRPGHATAHNMHRDHDPIITAVSSQAASENGDADDAIDVVMGSSDDSEKLDDLPIMDGMVEYQDASAEARESEAFYGNSSSFYFAMNVRASAVDKNESTLADHTRTVGRGKVSEPSKTQPQPSVNHDAGLQEPSLMDDSFQFLPQRHVANSLLERYFTAVHPIWPFLLEDITRQRFEDTWSSNGPASAIWTAQLNLIFALGFEFWEEDATARLPSRTAIEVGNDFYLRARNFIFGNAFNISSIGMVQSMLLMVQYQQGTMQPEQCWLTVGHATRMAQGLGLHKRDSRNDSASPMEEELRNRLWWGCFSLDRVSSMIYGRPTGIHLSQTSKYNLPKAIDDKFISLGQQQPVDVPSLNAFYHFVAKLYCVVDDILELLDEIQRGDSESQSTLDNNFRKPKKPPTTATIIDIDNKLLRWHDSLPTFLKFSIDSHDLNNDYDIAIQRQRNILRYRFLGVRILLHRQTLLYLLQPPGRRRWFQDTQKQMSNSHSIDSQNGPHSPFDSSFVQVSSKICVSSAEILIEAIAMGRPHKLAGAWWWDYYFTFNSLCVIFGAMNLRKADLSVVIPDTARTTALIERGFENIHAMASVGGPKAIQSERFLKQLMAATLRSAKKRSAAESRGKRTRVGTPSGGRSMNALPVNSFLSPSASLTSQNGYPEVRQDETMNPSLGYGGQPGDISEWLLNPSLWETTGLEYMEGPSPGPSSIEAMFQGSFDLWDTLDNMPGLA